MLPKIDGDPAEDRLPEPVTEMLRLWSSGRPEVGDRVVQILYRELKRIAAREFRRERPGHTLQATALVHEAYVRLRDAHGVAWENRAQFLGYAAFLMRRILVERARRKSAAKRGGGLGRVTLAEAEQVRTGRPTDLLAVDRALEELASVDRRKAAVVELRFFGGLSVRETATVLRLSPQTIDREWRRARAWLFRALGGGRESSGGS
jgi:RNA polymerase sigma factor (TIGR02999 family)